MWRFISMRKEIRGNYQSLEDLSPFLQKSISAIGASTAPRTHRDPSSERLSGLNLPAFSLTHGQLKSAGVPTSVRKPALFISLLLFGFCGSLSNYTTGCFCNSATSSFIFQSLFSLLGVWFLALQFHVKVNVKSVCKTVYVFQISTVLETSCYFIIWATWVTLFSTFHKVLREKQGLISSFT